MQDSIPTGIYSNIDIEEAMLDGHIICTPFDKLNVRQTSLDVTLGHYYYRTQVSADKPIYNPFDKIEVEAFFDGPYEAMIHEQWATMNGLKPLKNIPLDQPVISLKPGERILGHTHEFLGIKAPGAYILKSRSSWARNGIAVCLDAGFVDPGYINRLTLEIYNINSSQTIVLPVGERIAQAVFFHSGVVRGDYGKDSKEGFSGKYQHETDIENTMLTWSPDLMLPKAYQDKRKKPTKIDGIVYE